MPFVAISTLTVAFVGACASTPRTPFDSAEEVPPSAIRHVVLIDLKETADIPELIIAMDRELAPIPGILHYWRGEPFQAGRPEVREDYDVGLVIDFRDAEAYSAYSTDPRHVGLVSAWKLRINNLTIYDIRPNAVAK
ncbi:MAG: Dabb family protein [Phycisphaerae bacterium]|jgi:hypothetical protein|nr:Dabb family protein [Phycisphaerae bacterium]